MSARESSLTLTIVVAAIAMALLVYCSNRFDWAMQSGRAGETIVAGFAGGTVGTRGTLGTQVTGGSPAGRSPAGGKGLLGIGNRPETVGGWPSLTDTTYREILGIFPTFFPSVKTNSPYFSMQNQEQQSWNTKTVLAVRFPWDFWSPWTDVRVYGLRRPPGRAAPGRSSTGQVKHDSPKTPVKHHSPSTPVRHHSPSTPVKHGCSPGRAAPGRSSTGSMEHAEGMKHAGDVELKPARPVPDQNIKPTKPTRLVEPVDMKPDIIPTRLEEKPDWINRNDGHEVGEHLFGVPEIREILVSPDEVKMSKSDPWCDSILCSICNNNFFELKNGTQRFGPVAANPPAIVVATGLVGGLYAI